MGERRRVLVVLCGFCEVATEGGARGSCRRDRLDKKRGITVEEEEA